MPRTLSVQGNQEGNGVGRLVSRLSIGLLISVWGMVLGSGTEPHLKLSGECLKIFSPLLLPLPAL